MFTTNALVGCMGAIVYFMLLSGVTTKQVRGKVGIVYSPFVLDGKGGQRSKHYTKDDVKLMLELISEQGFRDVATHGVGAPIEAYLPNSTWKTSFSIVHTAVAAAEINKEKNQPILSIHQGLFPSPDEQQLNSEIEVGLEMAYKANNIFKGTVSSITYYVGKFDSAFHPSTLDKIEKLSIRTRQMNMKFGVRTWDCGSILHHPKSNPNFQKLLKSMDFIFCSSLPNREHDNPGGQKRFEKHITKEIDPVYKAIDETGLPIEVILETGWPSGEDLSTAATVANMKDLWKYIEEWSVKNKRRAFMVEAFDNPWKIEINELYHGAHYGIFTHSQTDDLSRKSYQLKKEQKNAGGSGSGGLSRELIFGIIFGLVLFTIVVIMIGFVYVRVKRLKFNSKLTEEEIRQFLDGIVTNEVVSNDCGDGAWQRIPYNKDFELQKGKYSIDKTALLGSGNFGSVYKGKIDGLVNEVAFKTTRSDCPISALKGLLSEIKILIFLGKHENIVSICGACTGELMNGTVYVATELCTNGSLENYLRSSNKNSLTNVPRYVSCPPSLDNKDITDLQLLRWSLDIASAMEFISSKHVIHADLATRNVLLTDNLTAKVTDFGLSRRLYEYTEYVKQHQEPLPWRWMAVESLKRLEFSTKSDVWSFGVTIWEIYSLGDVPYPGLSWDIEFPERLENGLVLNRPSRCPLNIYESLTSCWNRDPSCRPPFETLKNDLLTKYNFHLKN